MNTTGLPLPSAEAEASSRKLQERIIEAVRLAGGRIPFSRFMELALYEPQYGYYTGGAHKIGSGGDFVTAPEISPLFGRTLAVQLAELLPQTAGNLYEFGAGTGALAAVLLKSLPENSINNYFIIEISPELAERQKAGIRQKIPEAADKVVHLTALPESFDGIIIGNEVLDAMPVELIHRNDDGLFRVCVAYDNGFYPENIPAGADLAGQAGVYFPETTPYTSEIHPVQHAFVRSLADRLVRGGMIFIDYGFDAAQYYHPQRRQGTLVGHYRHYCIDDPFFRPGLTDLTAHVNFTDIAQAGTDAGLDLTGYLPQSRFLLNLGITGLMHNPTTEPAAYADDCRAVHLLTGQHEMGELFKVMAFGKNIDPDWTGFSSGDICHKL